MSAATDVPAEPLQADEEVQEARPGSGPRWARGITRNVFVLGLVSLFTDVASEMIVPIRSIFLANVLLTPMPIVGVIEGIAESTASILKVVSGRLSDSVPRRKPLLVFPRLASQREHRNDHQIGTARHFASRGLLLAAFSESELEEQLERLREAKPGAPPSPAAPELITRIRGFALGSRGD